METVCLADLKPGEYGVIDSMHLHGTQRRRLRDLGFLPGTKVQCGCMAPLGSPVAVCLKGSMFALRRETCKQILVHRCE